MNLMLVKEKKYIYLIARICILRCLPFLYMNYVISIHVNYEFQFLTKRALNNRRWMSLLTCLCLLLQYASFLSCVIQCLKTYKVFDKLLMLCYKKIGVHKCEITNYERLKTYYYLKIILIVLPL